MVDGILDEIPLGAVDGIVDGIPLGVGLFIFFLDFGLVSVTELLVRGAATIASLEVGAIWFGCENRILARTVATSAYLRGCETCHIVRCLLCWLLW